MSKIRKIKFNFSRKISVMASEHLRPLPGAKPASIISLNRYIFSGIRTKQSRDDIYKKFLTPKDINKKFQQKGLIIMWPQKPTSFFYNKELTWIMWVVAHGLYWLHVVDILPSGTAVPFEQPPAWKHEPPLHKPKSRDFIIEPDWESYHYVNMSLDRHF